MTVLAIDSSARTMTAERVFQLLADTTRLRAVLLVHAKGELCVCELTEALAISQPKMSRHLAVLRDAGVLADRRDRQWVYYRLGPGIQPWVRQVIEATAAGVAGREPFAADRAALAAMASRPGASPCE